MNLRGVLTIVALLSFCPVAGATTVITNDLGGLISKYEKRYTRLAKSGGRVIIDGGCLSACTLAVDMVKNVCATPNGLLGFHSGAEKGRQGFYYSRRASNMMYRHFSARTRAVLIRHGWDGLSEHPELIFIPASELVKTCPHT